MTNPNPYSDRVNRMRGSSTLEAALAATRLKEQGYDIIDLSVGEPDFDTPEFIKQYAWEGLNRGLTKYTPVAGLKTFKEAISEFYRSEFDAVFSPGLVAAACGGKQALFNAIATLVNPGEEVLIPKPYWVTFPEIVSFCGAKSVFIETEETDFVLTADQVKEQITDNTKLIIINSPSNPSGRVIPAMELRKIIDVCIENNVYLIADECYLKFVYPPDEIFSSASLPPEYLEYVCVAGSFSKTYAMTGWRIGFTITNENWTRQIIKLQGHSATHPTSFVQYACARALKDPEQSMIAVASMLAEYKKRRDWFVPALNAINGLKVNMPEGAFYAFADVRGLLGNRFQNSADYCSQLLNSEHVVVTDGAGFGADGFVRLSYAASIVQLQTAVKRIRSFLNNG